MVCSRPWVLGARAVPRGSRAVTGLPDGDELQAGQSAYRPAWLLCMLTRLRTRCQSQATTGCQLFTVSREAASSSRGPPQRRRCRGDGVRAASGHLLVCPQRRLDTAVAPSWSRRLGSAERETRGSGCFPQAPEQAPLPLPPTCPRGQRQVGGALVHR